MRLRSLRVILKLDAAGMRMLKRTERVLFVVGITLLGVCLVTIVAGRVSSRMAVKRFYSSSRHIQEQNTRGWISGEASQVDYSLWSEKRIHEYKASLLQHFGDPLAVLRIGKIHLEVPVFDGTDDLTLNRGVGRILGTARPGQLGNVGIAGHRDGFFRGLKDVALGDSLQLDTGKGMQTYTIDSITIVGPKDIEVLKDTGVPAITLVTCYPFYYIGSAPQRYIVHASLSDTPKPNEPVKASLKSH